jgi:uncharacterized Ntn-hydrolase superfamily protein
MTFSIAARCPRTGMIGLAISSSSPAVAARCAHARAGIGAVASQNITDPRLGPRGLDLMAAGLSASVALAALVAQEPLIGYRQLTLVDVKGGAAWYSGAHTLGIHAGETAENVAAAGNLLANADVPKRMIDGFMTTPLAGLGDRLLTALQAGLAAGGEAGPVHSAGLVLVRDTAWPIADLRVDWHDSKPLEALADLWRLWAPQMEAYVKRALDPAAAPTFGVPGDPAP